jgi:site-specific recombinase XerD
MKCLLVEVDKFTKYSRYTKLTKRRYQKFLLYFIDYISIITSTKPEEIDLIKFYEYVDIKGIRFYKSIDPQFINKYFIAHQHKSNSWLRYSYYALLSFFNYLYRNYNFPNIMQLISYKPEEQKNPESNTVLNRPQILKFFNSIIIHSDDFRRDSLLFILLFSTGCRISEILNINLEQIDIENELIYLKKTKNKSSKYIVLRDGYGIIIKTFIQQNSLSSNSYLFNKNGKKLTRDYVQELFSKYLTKGNLPQTNLHSIRKTFATVMYESGADLSVIQQLLNHKLLKTTRVYIEANYIRNLGVNIEQNKKVYQRIRRR